MDPSTNASRKWLKRIVVFQVVLAFAAMTASGFIALKIKPLFETKARLEREIAQEKHELEELQRSLGFLQATYVDKPVLRTDRRLDVEVILSSVKGKRHKEAIRLAIELYDRKVPFLWGGKSPDKGFDSSGYVAYVLSWVGVLEHPERYNSVALRKFLPSISPETVQPGDVIFYEGGPCVFYLEKGLSIGALPGGIATGDLDRVFHKIGAASFPE